MNIACHPYFRRLQGCQGLWCSILLVIGQATSVEYDKCTAECALSFNESRSEPGRSSCHNEPANLQQSSNLSSAFPSSTSMSLSLILSLGTYHLCLWTPCILLELILSVRSIFTLAPCIFLFMLSHLQLRISSSSPVLLLFLLIFFPGACTRRLCVLTLTWAEYCVPHENLGFSNPVDTFRAIYRHWVGLIFLVTRSW